MQKSGYILWMQPLFCGILWSYPQNPQLYLGILWITFAVFLVKQAYSRTCFPAPGPSLAMDTFVSAKVFISFSI